MATITVTLACTKSALVYEDTPSTNYHGAASYRVSSSERSLRNTALLLAFETLPATYQYRNIYSVKLVLTTARSINVTSMPPGLFFGTLEADFTAASVTWSTKPAYAQNFYNTGLNTVGSGDETVSVTAQISSSSDEMLAGVTALKAPAIRVYAGSTMSGSQYVDVYTEAAASGKRPYLEVTLSDTNASLSVTKNAVNGGEGQSAIYNRFPCNEDSTFSWDLPRVYGYTYADVVQTSATFYWRKLNALTWNSVSISGSTQSVTISANTLPAADIEWAVSPVAGSFSIIGGGQSYPKTAYPRIFAELAMTQAALASLISPDDVIPWDTSQANPVYHYMTPAPGTLEVCSNAYMAFESLPSAYRLKAVEAAGIRHRHVVNAGYYSAPVVCTLAGEFAAQTLTWNSAPADRDTAGRVYIDNSEGATAIVREFVVPGSTILFPNDFPGGYMLDGVSVSDAKGISQASVNLLTAPGLKMTMPKGSYSNKRYFGAVAGDPAPKLLALLFDATVTSKPAGKRNTSGWVDPNEAQVFSWDLVPDGDYSCTGGWTQASATFYWSDDDGDTWTSVAASGGTQSVTIAAGTLTSGTILWKVTATDDQGTTATSDVYTITTEDSATTATPVSPVNTVEDGSGVVTLVWTTTNEHNTEPTGADIQVSTDGSTWTDLASVSGSATRYDAPEDTFQAGTVYWRVRAYNADSVAGDWSDAVSFLSVNAPPAPVVSATAVPFSTVSWQSEGQQAWRVKVDGKTYGPYFGEARSFELPDYLENGGHTIQVEVQGSSGKWSKPGTATVQISNVPGAAVMLSGVFTRDAVLSWTCTDDTADFLVYRDGVRIGHTSAKGFTDRTVLGSHAWQVVNRLPGGFYTASNLAQGELDVSALCLAMLEGGDWLELDKSANESRALDYSHAQTVVLRQFAGEIYPSAEVSPYRTMSASFDAAWTYGEEADARAFEDMIGKTVIYKAPGGEALVGILSAWSRQGTVFFRSYAATVNRIHWREFIDEDA